MDKIFFHDAFGRTLCGILDGPKQKVRPMIILCHGLRSSKDSLTNIKIGEKLWSENISTFRIDLFGHGESESTLEDSSVRIFTESVIGAIDHLKNQGYTKIGIYAASFGGVASVIAAAEQRDLILLALKSPGMGQTSRHMMQFKKDFDEGTWFRAAECITIPTLIVHGDADENVELEQGQRLMRAIDKSKLVIVPGADHTYSKPADFEMMIKYLSDFIIEKCY